MYFFIEISDMCFKKNFVFVIRRYWYITKKLSTLGIYVDVLEYVGHIRRRTRLELMNWAANKPTQLRKQLEAATMLLDYAATHPNTKLRFTASDMVKE